MTHALLTYATVALFVVSFATMGISSLYSVREVRAIDKRRQRDAEERIERIKEFGFKSTGM